MRRFITASLLVTVVGCVSRESLRTPARVEKLQSATINYNDAVRGIHLEYPADWVEQGVPASGQVVLILQLPQKAESTGLAPTFQISQQIKGGKLELAQIENAVVERGQNSLNNFQLLGNVPTTLGGEAAKQITYRGSSSGINVQTMTTITLHDGQGFAVSFAADPNEFGAHLPSVQRVLASLAFTK